MKSSHIPKKAPSFTYPVQLLEKISSSANDLWDDYFGGLPYCTASALRRVLVCAACTRPGRRPPCSVFSMEHPVRWIMAHPEFRTDIYSFIHSPHMLNLCYFWIHKLSSYPNVRSGIHPTALSVPPFMKKKEEKGQVHRTYEVKKEKKKKKKKRKENNLPGTQMFPSLHKLNGFTSTRHLDILWSRLHQALLIATQPVYRTYEGQGKGRDQARPRERNLFVFLSLNHLTTIYGWLSIDGVLTALSYGLGRLSFIVPTSHSIITWLDFKARWTNKQQITTLSIPDLPANKQNPQPSKCN